MVQPEDIRRKAGRIYKQFLRAWLEDRAATFFPYLIRTERELTTDIAEAATLVEALRRESKAVVGYGYSVEWRQIASRTLGRNLFPQRITFDTQEDLLRLVARRQEFTAFAAAVERLHREFPELDSWLRRNIAATVAMADEFEGLLAVLAEFKRNPRPGCFARELPVPVDTKFVEWHRRLLAQWLDVVLPPEAIQADEDHFERRYGLRYVEPEVFARFLDAGLQQELGFPFDAMSLPLHTLAKLAVRDAKVVIVENKVNVLTMPRLARTIVLGGMGNSCVLLRYVPWLARAPVTYWGDIDVQGLEILARLRGLFPQTQSILMNEPSLCRWRHLAGRGTGHAPSAPPNLTPGELAAFQLCVAENMRLEQERIPQAEVVAAFACFGLTVAAALSG